MKLTGSFDIPAPREEVYQAITDPEVVRKCLEGCERMSQIGEGVYEAHMKLGMAGIKGTYVGKITMKDQKPPDSYTLVVEGKGTPGFLKATARVRLADKQAHTELHCESEAQVGGMIAAIGSRLIEAAARKMMHSFFQKFAEEMKAQSP